MTLNQCVKIIFLSALALQVSVASAAERSIFGNKKISQHELTNWEKKKMDAEFRSVFSGADSAAFQKLNKNPWGAKKQDPRRVVKSRTLAANWASCRDYAYKQRVQCYSRNGDAYTCERYYDARVNRCNDKF